ncbi:MAG: tellurite resistance/C4-dicarboxylate transporter family protein [Candidatus Eisenbacteria bacterium]|nr:tellurite resistance/C4-dicarboxylate transporter family protein [Candidatus Eisenbacteria bacterium]
MTTGDLLPVSDDSAPSGRLARAVAGLFPGYFALVMATGIVSIAGELLGWRAVAVALLAVNLPVYAILVLMTLARAVFHRRRLLADLADHARGSGFFTTVAGTCVLGSQCLIVGGWRGPAQVLLAAGLVLWAVVMYSFFTIVIVRRIKPSLERGINGAWLIATVATQSVAVLAITLRTPFGWPKEEVAFGAIVFFLIGCMLYLAIITLIFYRFTFVSLLSVALTPTYWITMGAVAITTLTGSALLLARDASPLLAELRPFLLGFTLFFWAAGTWWVPLLMMLGIWRHAVRRYPFAYDPQYWGMVFPLGMYAAATWRLAQALPFAPLEALARVFLPLALALWAITAIGLVRHLVHGGHHGDGPRALDAEPAAR